MTKVALSHIKIDISKYKIPLPPPKKKVGKEKPFFQQKPPEIQLESRRPSSRENPSSKSSMLIFHLFWGSPQSCKIQGDVSEAIP